MSAGRRDPSPPPPDFRSRCDDKAYAGSTQPNPEGPKNEGGLADARRRGGPPFRDFFSYFFAAGAGGAGGGNGSGVTLLIGGIVRR